MPMHFQHRLSHFKGIVHKKIFCKISYFGIWWGVVQLILVGGVWKPPKLTKFGLISCLQGFGLRAVGVSTRGARGFQWHRELKLLPPWVQTPSCAASSNPRGQDFRPNFVRLGCFQTPPTKMSYNTPHHIPKFESLQKNLWTITLNVHVEMFWYFLTFGCAFKRAA